jgi:hypothetical protein
MASCLYTKQILVVSTCRHCRDVRHGQVENSRLRVFENGVLMRIFEPKRDEVTRDWRRIHYEKLYALYSTPSIILMIKSKRLRWAGHVALEGEERSAYRVFVEKLRK